MPLTAILLLTSLVSAGSRAHSLQVEVRGQPRCPSRAQVVAELHQKLTGVGDTSQVRLELRRTARELTVVFHAGAVTHRRSVQVGRSQCGELAETVAYLTRSWLAALPALPTEVIATQPRSLHPAPVATKKTSHKAIAATSPQHLSVDDSPPAPAPQLASDVPTPAPDENVSAPAHAAQTQPTPVPDGGLSTETRAISPAQPKPTANVSDAGVPETAATPAPQTPDAGVVAAGSGDAPATHPAEAHVARAPTVTSLSVFLSGGGSLGAPEGSESTAGADGSLALDLQLGRGHVIVEGELLTGLTGSLPPGTVSVGRDALSALGAFELVQNGRFVLDALGGVRVEIWNAAAHGFSVNRTQTVWIPGATLGLRVRVRLIWRLSAFARVEGSLLAIHSFDITGVSGQVTPALFWAAAEGGLGLDLW